MTDAIEWTDGADTYWLARLSETTTSYATVEDLRAAGFTPNAECARVLNDLQQSHLVEISELRDERDVAQRLLGDHIQANEALMEANKSLAASRNEHQDNYIYQLKGDGPDWLSEARTLAERIVEREPAAAGTAEAPETTGAEQPAKPPGETAARDRYCCHVCFGPGSLDRMILCSTCGNKRCPKASDHRLECSGSNEPGQPGSVYCLVADQLEKAR